MKRFRAVLLTGASVLIGATLLAQARPMSTMIENQNRDAVMIEINQPVNIATDALQQKLQRAGLNEKIVKGSGTYKGVVLSEISKEKVDIYTKVEGGPNNTSMVYMAVSKGYDHFTNKQEDSSITENVVAFLNSFVQDADNHFADVDITKQVSSQNKSENDYQKLLSEQADLQKKKSKIDSRLLAIQTQIDAQKMDLDKKKTDIEDSKVKRSADKNQ